MKMKERVRALRAQGISVSKIADTLGINISYAYWCKGDAERGGPEPTHHTVVRHGAHNGGCSTLSGMMAITMPRIVALHGELA